MDMDSFFVCVLFFPSYRVQGATFTSLRGHVECISMRRRRRRRRQEDVLKVRRVKVVLLCQPCALS